MTNCDRAHARNCFHCFGRIWKLAGFAVLSFQCQNSAKQRKQWASRCFQIAKAVQS